MESVDKTNRIPICSWCAQVEPGAMKQAVNLTQLPFVYRHVALMADCHEGFGMPIGGVIACDGAVIPNAVGVDIGCGMCAVQTDLAVGSIQKDQIVKILRLVRKRVPLGFDHHPKAQSWEGFDHAPDIPVVQRELDSARKQLGTLGGGNHFIEIQKGDDGFVWLMIHSGSRNFGYKVAAEYHKAAIGSCEKRKAFVPDKDLAFLPMESTDSEKYLEAMNYALAFAHENRQRMKRRVKESVASVVGCGFAREINVHHNFASVEEHYGRRVVVHRKGATRARKDEPGIIPGSMGTPSYIVAGKGNPQSFESCSHGAGRVMGRKEANRRLTLQDARAAMKGIVFDSFGRDRRGRVDLSEAPQAYKDIDKVIEAQGDLVDVVVKLWPLGVVKG